MSARRRKDWKVKHPVPKEWPTGTTVFDNRPRLGGNTDPQRATILYNIDVEKSGMIIIEYADIPAPFNRKWVEVKFLEAVR